MIKTNTCLMESGDLYAFGRHANDESVWGVFDSQDTDGNIILEVASSDFNHFTPQVTLPTEYCHVRLATRDELRDFMYNMGCRHI